MKAQEKDLKLDMFYEMGIRYGGMNKDDWIDVAERLFKENMKLKKRVGLLSAAKISKKGV